MKIPAYGQLTIAKDGVPVLLPLTKNSSRHGIKVKVFDTVEPAYFGFVTAGVAAPALTENNSYVMAPGESERFEVTAGTDVYVVIPVTAGGAVIITWYEYRTEQLR